MSFSLRIRNGDLALGGTSLDTVEGGEKLVQDLSCALLTPLGSYEAHPQFGSALDGGITNDGYTEGVFGERDWRKAATIVQAEIQRICTDYQAQQVNRNAADATNYGRPTLTPEETLLSVGGMKFVQAQDRLLATVNLNIGTGTVQLNVPLGNE